MDTYEVLVIHCTLMAAVLAAVSILLSRGDSFHFRSAAFWAWCGIVLYLFLGPLIAVLQGNVGEWDSFLSLSGGSSRALWISVVSLVGIITYFGAYIKSRSGTPTWNLKATVPGESFTTPQFVVLGLISIIGLWSLMTYRSGLMANTGLTVINGRNVGSATGYQNTAHMFLFFIVALFLSHSSHRYRRVGYGLATIYVIVGSFDPWARYLQVSMILVVALATLVRRGTRRWPNIYLVLLALFIGLLLGVRGHTTFSSLQDIFDLTSQVPAGLSGQFSGAETNLLNSWYLQSYVDDSLVGYNYGLALANYALTGFLPNSYFPDKYFLIDWLKTQQPLLTNPTFLSHMNGQATSLMGSFYSDGGIVGVAILSPAWGYLSRKIEGMLHSDAPITLRALGLTWMSMLWMVWGRGDTWTLNLFGTVAIPAFVMWAISAKQRWGTVRDPRERRGGANEPTESNRNVPTLQRRVRIADPDRGGPI